jgi:putative spermidine/putrescine transport system permease protein
LSLTWLGLLPFLVFAVALLVMPQLTLIVGSFQDASGAFTVQNYLDLSDDYIATAYKNSIELSLITALLGGVVGFLIALAVIHGRLPRFIRSGVMTFSGVASNFAGVPLSLSFIFTIGPLGFITLWLQNTFGFRLWQTDVFDSKFTLYSRYGLVLVYLYFQLPLMVLVIAPSIDGLRREWREAAENMGASAFQYWRHVGLPILLPSLLGSMILLFGNAFGAQATAYSLTAGQIPLAPIVIGLQLSGDVLHNPNLAYALAMGMIVIMAIAIVVYSVLQRRSERWLRS